MLCRYCGRSDVHPCWNADEAGYCGNLGTNEARMAKEWASAVTKVERARERAAGDLERTERRELARLKAKYEAKK